MAALQLLTDSCRRLVAHTPQGCMHDMSMGIRHILQGLADRPKVLTDCIEDNSLLGTQVCHACM